MVNADGRWSARVGRIPMSSVATIEVVTTTGMPLPTPRGPLSGLIVDVLTDRPVAWAQLLPTAKMVAASGVVRDEDAQLSLLMLYELHYRGLAGVSDSWEWHPELLAVRAVLEDRFETEIRDLTVVPAVPE